MPQLVSLVEFYKIAGWKTWGASFKKIHDTVHDAVHARPDMALQELASYLGLEYSRVNEIIGIGITERKIPEQTLTKIRRVEDAENDEKKKEEKKQQTKPFRPSPPIPKEVPSPQTLAKYMSKGKDIGAPPPPSRPSTKRVRDPRVSSPSSSAQNPAKKRK